MKEVEAVKFSLGEEARTHAQLIGKLTYFEVCSAGTQKINAPKFAVDK